MLGLKMKNSFQQCGNTDILRYVLNEFSVFPIFKFKIMLVTKNTLDKLTYRIIGTAIEVQKVVGPGLLEKVYQKCLAKELLLRGIKFQEQVKLRFDYKGEHVDLDLMFDFFVEDLIVVELKATKEFTPLHEAQILGYMKLLRAPKGILINFNTTNIFYQGQRTLVNEFFEKLPDS
jgi:GxxExxY protein